MDLGQILCATGTNLLLFWRRYQLFAEIECRQFQRTEIFDDLILCFIFDNKYLMSFWVSTSLIYQLLTRNTSKTLLFQQQYLPILFVSITNDVKL